MSGSFSFKSAAFGPVPDHLHGKWSTIVLIEKHPRIFSAFLAKFCHRAPWFSFQVLEEKLIPVTIFWIFSSFFSMLDLTAQILSCWSLISCSSSASSTLRGSTALSVALWHIKQNGEGMINCLHAIRLKNMSRNCPQWSANTLTQVSQKVDVKYWNHYM